MPWHTAPEFRQMLLDIANGQIEVAPVLADWLEERGDERAERVRLFAKLHVMEYNDGAVAYWYIGATCTAGGLLLLATTPAVNKHLTPDRARNELAMLILQLFPEGPRWIRSIEQTEESTWKAQYDLAPSRDTWHEPDWPEQLTVKHYAESKGNSHALAHRP